MNHNTVICPANASFCGSGLRCHRYVAVYQKIIYNKKASSQLKERDLFSFSIKEKNKIPIEKMSKTN